MFESNGIVYASALPEDARVAGARVVGDHCMLVRFSTGEVRLFDATPLLCLPAFSPLASDRAFSDFSIDHGIITWLDGAVDIAPEAVYGRSYEYRKSA